MSTDKSGPQSLTLRQQLGFEADPNKLEHTVSSSGAPVTKMESSQPGFPVYHRRIANPVPLTFICIGAFFILYGALLTEVRGLRNWQIILNIGLPLCGPGLMAASMFSFAEGSTFLATFAGSLSGILSGYSLTFLPWTGIAATYIETAQMMNEPISAGLDQLQQAQGMLFLIAMIPIFVLLVGSVRTSIPISATTLFMVLAFILQGANLLQGGEKAIQYAAGAFFWIAGIICWYISLSVLLQEEKIGILPVFPLPRVA
ncbi:hypothetical protein BDZ90DRAFT_254705 [Jaminaea rosea]|uniref:GPR1/FUN34/YaaH-class plasma membrane protein n=1 Tax=Jaminaea rosea TaxID=1569628 RepID=A0A316UL76_9BASI|nr:hypothetical protein BDZ90DRAFT_254705 [Jaminaea rosea]PWN26036.1 hypothetical protein BDZ90DRAFT_254705 [Jaminaea rosea]